MIRKFEVVTGFENDAIIPKRGSQGSAGYDFYALEDTIIPPFFKKRNFFHWLFESHPTNKPTLVKTGIKAKFPKNQVLELFVRSSIALKQGLFMANSVGIIDADYYNNPKNEGHIHGMIYNHTDKPITIKKGERFMQGIFKDYYTVDNDNTIDKREGGFGSTNKK